MNKNEYIPKWMRASLKSDKELLYVDMDGVLCNFDKAKEEWIKAGNKPNSLYAIDGFFTTLEPIKDAIESIELLEQYYDVYILSTAPWSSPYAWKDKRIWVEKNLNKNFKKKLILSHNKGLFKGKALIDDRIANGVLDFTGEHIHFGTAPYENWKKIVDYLKPKENESTSNTRNK
jgi:5'-nucleotidase